MLYIRTFESFVNFSLNEAVDMKKININELLSTKNGFDALAKIMKKEMGADLTQTTTYGYDFTFPYNEKNKEIVEAWNILFGIDWIEKDRITNKEHPRYGEYFYKFNAMRNPKKFMDLHSYMKRLNTAEIKKDI